MPVVIDLLSSPDWIPSRPDAPLKTTNTKRIPAHAPLEPISSNAPSKSKDDWLSLSSDDEVNYRLPRPSVAKAFRAVHITAANPVAPQPKATVPKDNAFYYLSDDFDSTVHLDESAMDLPQAKKRRLSPSPKAASSKSTGLTRSISNTDRPSTNTGPSLKKSKAIVDVDPIVFTSSPDPSREAAKRRKQKRQENQDPDDSDDVFGLKPPRLGESSRAEKDLSSDEDFPDIDALPSKPTTKKASPRRNSSETALAKYNKEKAAQKKVEEKAEAVKAKAQAKKDKDAEREAEKERKTQEKEDKKRNKEKAQELAKVNISRNDKKISSPEMIVDMSSGLDSLVAEQVKLFLAPLEVEHSTWEDTLPVVKWRRKVTARYDEEKGHWEPVPPHIKPEQHIIYVMSAKEFVERATGDEGADLDIHVLQLKAKFDSCQIIYLIEGLMPWMKKNQNLKNRQFTDAVRSQLPQEEPTASQRRKKKEPEYVDEDILEDALLKLQVIHGAMIHHVPVKFEVSQWIVNFTQHISTIPYK
jgi:crossover junction endonuclease EME1